MNTPCCDKCVLRCRCPDREHHPWKCINTDCECHRTSATTEIENSPQKKNLDRNFNLIQDAAALSSSPIPYVEEKPQTSWEEEFEEESPLAFSGRDWAKAFITKVVAQTRNETYRQAAEDVCSFLETIRKPNGLCNGRCIHVEDFEAARALKPKE
jgi:hypothetical protein